MAKLWLVCVYTLVLSGCAAGLGPGSTSSKKERSIDETFLVQSNNYARLIEFYKEQLKEDDTVSTRLKLAQAYVDINDNESALFTLAPVIANSPSNSTAFYLQGVAQYKLGKLPQSLRSLEIAEQKAPRNARTINMLGVAQAELGMLREARTSFNKAREFMYDDVTIKNNLALLDMLEGDFKQAASRLMPIYINTPSKADAKLKANLAIIMAKLGSFETLRSMYSDQYNDAELFGIFQNLRASEPATRVSPRPVSKKTPHEKMTVSALDSTQIEVENREAQETQSLLKESEVIQPSTLNGGATIGADKSSSAAPTNSMVKINTETRKSDKAELLSPASALREEAPELVEDVPELVEEVPESVLLSEILPNFKRNEEPASVVKAHQNRKEFSELTGVKRYYEGHNSPLIMEQVPSQDTLKTDPNRLNAQETQSVKNNHRSLPDSIIGVERRYKPAPQSEKKATQEVATSTRLYESKTLSKPLSPAMKESNNGEQSIHTTSDFVKLGQYSLAHDTGLSIPVAQFRHHGDLIDIMDDSTVSNIGIEKLDSNEASQ